MLMPRHASEWFWLAALAGAMADGGQAAGPEPLTRVTVQTWQNRSWTTLAVPGQWIYVSERTPLHGVYRRGRELYFEEVGKKLFVRIDGGPAQVACLVVETPEDLAELKRLIAEGARELAIATTYKGIALSALPALPAGRDFALVVHGGPYRELGRLSWPTGVTALKLADWRDAGDPSPLAELPDLRSLALYRCRLVHWRSLAKLSQLQVLELDSCSDLRDLSPVAKLAGLTSLGVKDWYESVSGFGELASLTGLRRLSLRGCRRLTDLAPLAHLARLEELEVSSDVADLSPLAKLAQLRRLSVAGNQQARDLFPLLELRKLESLSLAGCPRVTGLDTLARMTGLKELDLSRCRGFSDLSPLAGVKRKMRLDLRGCRGVADLRPLKPMLRAGAEVLVDERLQAQLEALGKTDF